MGDNLEFEIIPNVVLLLTRQPNMTYSSVLRAVTGTENADVFFNINRPSVPPATSSYENLTLNQTDAVLMQSLTLFTASVLNIITRIDEEIYETTVAMKRDGLQVQVSTTKWYTQV